MKYFIFTDLLAVLFWAANASAGAPALRCVHGQIRVPGLQPARTENSDYCYDRTFTKLLSKGCATGKACGVEALLRARRSGVERNIPRRGTPGSSICRQIGARAQVMEFWAEGSWHKLNRCLGQTNGRRDGSFIDLGTLVRWAGP